MTKIKHSEIIKIFTDGACQGNPGPGGWACIIYFSKKKVELSGAEPETTNNQMELMAAIKALEAITVPSHIELVSDSNYLVKGMTEWLMNWKKADWKSSNKKIIKNLELWKQLDKLAEKHLIKWKWVQGHSGHIENERCDELARKAISEL